VTRIGELGTMLAVNSKEIISLLVNTATRHNISGDAILNIPPVCIKGGEFLYLLRDYQPFRKEYLPSSDINHLSTLPFRLSCTKF
jgi:hypothetical protein